MADGFSADDLEKWTRAARVKRDNPSLSLAELSVLLPIPDPKRPGKTKPPSTATVDRWIKAAADLGILEYKVNVPPDAYAAMRLERCLKPKIPNVTASVVPNGDGKNLDNLSPRAARFLMDTLCAIDKPRTSIVLACGDTVRRTIHEFFELLKEEPENKEILASKTLAVYPASIHADYRLSPVYPCAAVALFDVLAAESTWPDVVEAFTPNLPQAFYERYDTPDKIVGYCVDAGLQPIVDEARSADVFVIGLGSTGGNNYRSILNSMDGAIEDSSRISDDVAELLFVPLDKQSNPDQEISDRIVGIVPDDLRRAINDGRTVLGVFGGSKESLVGCLVRTDPYMNVYITDSSCARAMIDECRPH